MDFENRQVPPSILDKYTKVCTCCSISRKTIKDAIANGHTTIPAIQKETGAGQGSCHGKQCTIRIVKLLQESGHLPTPKK